MFKTHRSRPFKTGCKNWLKRSTKTVLIAFFKKTQRYCKVKYFAILRYNCNKDFILQDLNE